MHVRLKSTPGIYVAGFMGSGKTTIGCKLSQKLAWDFVDLDDEIERRAKSSISEIFARYGEQAFRFVERDALVEQVQWVKAGRARVLALGGGTFADERNRETMKAGLSIWLDVPLEELWGRVAGSRHRPLALDRKGFEELYGKRLKDYAKADLTIAAGVNDPDKIVDDILSSSLF